MKTTKKVEEMTDIEKLAYLEELMNSNTEAIDKAINESKDINKSVCMTDEKVSLSKMLNAYYKPQKMSVFDAFTKGLHESSKFVSYIYNDCIVITKKAMKSNLLTLFFNNYSEYDKLTKEIKDKLFDMGLISVLLKSEIFPYMDFVTDYKQLSFSNNCHQDKFVAVQQCKVYVNEAKEFYTKTIDDKQQHKQQTKVNLVLLKTTGKSESFQYVILKSIVIDWLQKYSYELKQGKKGKFTTDETFLKKHKQVEEYDKLDLKIDLKLILKKANINKANKKKAIDYILKHSQL